MQISRITFKEADFGRVFEEMNVVADGNTIRCVGNVADMNSNSAKPNDIYVNLRFVINGAATHGTDAFTVVNNGFANKDEQMTEVSITDVKY